MLQIKTFVFNGMRSNTHLLWQENGDCVIIDAGCNNQIERDEMIHFISLNHLNPLALILTHAHFDHTMGAAWLCNRYTIDAYLHTDDLEELTKVQAGAGVYGIQIEDAGLYRPLHLYDLETRCFGSIRISVLHTPGHTAGSACFYEPTEQILFSGDTLIKGSLGFSNAGYSELLNHLKEKILPLPAQTRIFPGHGAATTIEEEGKWNPFFRIMKREQK